MKIVRAFASFTERLLATAAMLATVLAIWVLIPSTLNGQTKPSTRAHPSHYAPSPFPKRAAMYYGLVWGIDSLSVKAVESGELIRFSYRILDPSKATVFNDKKLSPLLELPRAHARLVVPSLEKVGQLRQYNKPETGKSYWMAFSNPRLTVKRGDYVNIIIGRFHANGLIVQ